jgi:hypothetical protein
VYLCGSAGQVRRSQDRLIGLFLYLYHSFDLSDPSILLRVHLLQHLHSRGQSLLREAFGCCPAVHARLVARLVCPSIGLLLPCQLSSQNDFLRKYCGCRSQCGYNRTLKPEAVNSVMMFGGRSLSGERGVSNKEVAPKFSRSSFKVTPILRDHNESLLDVTSLNFGCVIGSSFTMRHDFIGPGVDRMWPPGVFLRNPNLDARRLKLAVSSYCTEMRHEQCFCQFQENYQSSKFGLISFLVCS